MSSVVKPLHELITHLISSQERLEPYKMTQKQISEIFAWLDHRRRGYIDVSDFYAKFSELTENQLFYVFKFLDTSRKGAFKLQDLEAALCVKSGCNRDPQDDSIRSFTNLVRVLKATFHLIQQQRRKCHLTASTLEQIFNRACQKKKDKIDITDFVILLKEASLQLNEKTLIYIKNKFFSKASLTLKQFTQAFSQYIWNQDSGKIESSAKHMLEQKIESTGNYIQNKTAQKIKSTEKINSQIDKILQKYRQPTHHTHTTQLNQIQEQKQEMQYGKIDLESFLTKPDNRFQSKILQEFQNSQMNMKYVPREVPKQYLREPAKQYLREPAKDYGRQYTKDYARQDLMMELPRQLKNDYLRSSAQAQQQRYEKILSTSSNVGLNYSPKGNSQSYSEISRRREELRKGSLQRQRIIDDLMNKKKSEYASINKPGMLYSHNLKIETKFNEPEASFLNSHSYINRSATPTSKTSQPKINYDNSFIGKLYENSTIQKQLQFRPASATKASNFYDKAYYNKFDHNSRPDLLQFYRKGTEPSKTHDKENILKKAEQEATKKIEQIQRRAKLKVMEKRSTAGVYNRWLK